jgi:hypothetical protein
MGILQKSFRKLEISLALGDYFINEHIFFYRKSGGCVSLHEASTLGVIFCVGIYVATGITENLFG